jgi:ATP-dependent RNA helicase RhlE
LPKGDFHNMTHHSQQPALPQGAFYGLGIAPKILEILDRMKFTVPTPIQHKAIPILTEGKDMIGVAQTGTGKTLAFAIPILQRLGQGSGRGLVLVPTRELAVQVDETFQKFRHILDIRSVVLIGGASMFNQIQELKKNPRVIIATPGRLIDHLEQRTLHLRDATIVVLDEADRMLDMGFMPQIERVLRAVPRERQTMLFSATMPAEVVKIASSYMKLPTHIEVAPTGTAAEGVVQELFVVKKEAKEQLLSKILAQYHGSVLLFVRTKIGAMRVARAVKAMGHKAAEIHSNLSLSQRREALEGFKTGRYRVLVATDIAARGIDVIGIELVINYDIPEDAENYVHRIGRTGRAGHEGRAISFATPDQGQDVRQIEILTRTMLPISKHPDLPQVPLSAQSGHRPHHQGGGGPGGFRRNKSRNSSFGFGRNRPRRHN